MTGAAESESDGDNTLGSFFSFCLLSVLLLLPGLSSVSSGGDQVVTTEPLNNVASVPRWKNLSLVMGRSC